MFVDYYAILEIDEEATQEQIKIAFKKQALKWHPDRNPGVDTTKRMQEINEAYLILKDNEARSRYDQEYQRFKKFTRDERQHKKEQKKQDAQDSSYQHYDYQVNDDLLNKWINNAKKQAVSLAKQTVEDLKGMVSVSIKEATKEAGNQFLVQIIISVLFVVIIGLTKACGG
jgi:DnaJ-class molecular chaperone